MPRFFSLFSGRFTLIGLFIVIFLGINAVTRTLLALLNWSYQSKLLGQNILTMKPEEERAFVGTYQKLGYLKGNRLTVLSPGAEQESFLYDRVTEEQVKVGVDESALTDTIAYDQSASWLYKHGRLRRIKGA